jgi:hypothetical protein
VKTLLPFCALLLYAPLALAAGVSVEGLISLIVWLIIVGLIFWLLWWFIGYIGLPEPFNKVARVLIGLVAFLILIYLLLGILGPMPRLH